MRQPHRVIAPVTFADDARAVVDAAAAFAAAFGAELVLAGIAPSAVPEQGPDGAGAPGSFARRAEQQALLDRLVGERLQELAGALAGDVRVRTLVTWGPTGPALVATAREERADLIVLPMRRESGLRHLVHDHADRHVLHRSSVPVLVVPIP